MIVVNGGVEPRRNTFVNRIVQQFTSQTTGYLDWNPLEQAGGHFLKLLNQLLKLTIGLDHCPNLLAGNLVLCDVQGVRYMKVV